jgi:replicative DNA helicase
VPDVRSGPAGNGAAGAWAGVVDDDTAVADTVAETALLGAMLLSSEARDAALRQLDADDFGREAHSLVYAVIKMLVDEDLPVDLVSVTSALIDCGWLDTVGGAASVSLLCDPIVCPSPEHYDYYLMLVARESRRRQMRRALVRAVADLDRGEDPDTVAGRICAAVAP